MRKVMFFKFGGKDARTPRLIGAFVLTAAVLMFFSSIAIMFDSWDAVNDLNECLVNVDVTSFEAEYRNQVQECRITLFNKTGLYLKPGQGQPTLRQSVQVLLEPIAGVFFWMSILFLGWLLYKSGDLSIPVEMRVLEQKQNKKIKK